MKTLVKRSKLTIFVGGDERRAHHTLFQEVVNTLRSQGVAGITLIRGFLSYGQGEHIHSQDSEVAMDDLPMVVEAIDTEQKIRNVADEIAALIDSYGLIQIQSTMIAVSDSEGSNANASPGSR